MEPVTQPPWPLVDVHDDGIRPAGKPDECFYCQQKVGQEHGRECVIVTKKVRVRWSFDVVVDEPHSFTPSDIEFHYGGGSWCANNAVAALQRLYHEETGVCACEVFSSQFIEVVDETPTRKVREP